MEALHSDNESTVVPITLLDTRGAVENRRRRPRVVGQVTGWLLPVDGKKPDEEPWEVRVEDVSRLGVGFETANPIEAGEVLRIRIGRGPMNLAKRMRVVNCRSSGSQGTTWRIGAEFC